MLGVGGCFVFGASAQAEGRLEGGRIVRSIAESWNSEILLTRFTPEVRATTDPGELRKFVGVLRDRLGVLKVLGSARTDGWQVVFGIQGIAVW
ncbi:MAG TPA: hypothetical protein VFX69_10080, partial [Steroidobacteraceae bacterium]|nr:hypothetical protein [Steroidobacteraceae bacterium]